MDFRLSLIHCKIFFDFTFLLFIFFILFSLYSIYFIFYIPTSFQEKNVLVGSVNIPVANVSSRSHIEKWYQVQNENRAPSKDNSALRIKCKFQSIDILPMELYTNFLQVSSSVFGNSL